MAMAIASAGFSTRSHLPKWPSFPFPNAAPSFHENPTSFSFSCSLYSANAAIESRKLRRNVPFAVEKKLSKAAAADANNELELRETSQTNLYSFAPLPMLFVAALPGEWLVHWGHPGNMAVVLFAMGGYGTYLGFRIRSSNNMEEKALAKDLHPKLLGGMFFFFALGATGGITSLLTSDKPILESPHAVTGIIGLSLLAVQSILPSLFEGNVGLRNVHGILGSGIMTLFFIHAVLGLQLGLSY